MGDNDVFDKVNKLLTEDESKIKYEELIIQIKELKQKVPDFKIIAEPSVKCFGTCLENKKSHVEDQIISIPGHHHQYCSKCLTSWVLSSFLNNPFNSILCQRCQTESLLIEIPLEIIYSIIPINVIQSYQCYFNSLYFKCIVCTNPFPYQTIISMFCGHFYCQNDFISSNLKIYQSIIKGKTETSQEILEFQINCVCQNYFTKDQQSLAFFNSLAKNLDDYNPLKFFYLKYQDFFEGKSALHQIKCCKKYKTLKNSEIKNCFKCYKCSTCQLPIHEGMTCQEFQGLSDKYSIVESDFWTQEQVENVTPSFVKLLIKSFLGNIRKIYKIFNKVQEISKRFRRVWEYGFIFGDDFEMIRETCNEGQGSFIEIQKNIEFKAKFVLVCEVHGDRIERNQDFDEKDGVIYDFKNSMKVSKQNQVRFLYLIEINVEE